jgi:hypothetical protein
MNDEAKSLHFLLKFSIGAALAHISIALLLLRFCFCFASASLLLRFCFASALAPDIMHKV